jgi:hypothetical protein
MNASKNNGRWIVIGLLALGVILALVGLKYRRHPPRENPATTPVTRPM